MLSEKIISAFILFTCNVSSIYSIYYLITPKTIGQKLKWNKLNPINLNDDEAIKEKFNLIKYPKNRLPNIRNHEEYKTYCTNLFKYSLNENEADKRYEKAKDSCTLSA